MTQHYPLILDSLIIVLLLATIFYAAMLSRRLSRFRDNKAELEKAALTFTEAAGRADAGIKGLKLTAGKAGATLQKEIDRAQSLRDELAFLVDAGEAVAARLEGAAQAAGKTAPRPPMQAVRPVAGGGPVAAVAPVAATARAGRPETGPRQPDRDLLKAIENMR